MRPTRPVVVVSAGLLCATLALLGPLAAWRRASRELGERGADPVLALEDAVDLSAMRAALAAERRVGFLTAGSFRARHEELLFGVRYALAPLSVADSANLGTIVAFLGASQEALAFVREHSCVVLLEAGGGAYVLGRVGAQ